MSEPMRYTHSDVSHDEILEHIRMARAWARFRGRKLLLDAYCCQGAMSSGYNDAGFMPFGVDIDPRALARYPFDKVRADAVWFIGNYGHLFDAISASPPCQDYSITSKIVDNDFPRLIGPTRQALDMIGVPWVIENVGGARDELIEPITLCGCRFGINTYRPRLFEFGHWEGVTAPECRAHTDRTVKMGRSITEGDYYHAVGNFSGVAYVRRDLNLPWMNRDGLRECAPRQYGQYIGVHLMAEVIARADEAWHDVPINV